MMRLPSITTLAVLLAAAMFAAPASAQRSYDDDGYAASQDRGVSGARDVAGVFDYYSLVMSWSPSYCSERSRDGYEPQCDRNDGRRYAFVLHGLWPQYERGYPGNCRTRRKPFVPQPVIDSMLDIMPSPRLIIHEYRKHGTCSGMDPAGYYGIARKLFKSVRVPSRYANPLDTQFSTIDDLEREILAANPQLKPEMISVACNGSGGRLKELRICFSKEGQPRACGTNEDQRRLCSASRIVLPPVRSTKLEPDTAEDYENMKGGKTNRPRVIESLR